LSARASLTPREFVEKWRHASGLKERSAAQEHFIDLCRMLGHATPAEMDPEGERFCFEAGATKHSGGQGWADVWKRGFFAWEYKGAHADLDKAYDQLLQYREALENPPLLIVSDLETIRIHTNFTNSVKTVYEVTFDDLLDTHTRRHLHHAFFDPQQLKSLHTPEQVTEKAAAEFGRLAEQLRAYGDGTTNDEIAHFLIRLLFCLFAEDAGLLPEGLFTTLIQRTQGKSKAFVGQLRQLFAAMQDGGWFGSEEIRHFDGHLFDGAKVLELDGDGMHTLARLSQLDWSSIEPSIFGTLFERSLDPSKRSQLGAHYTGRDDILLIVEPVLMAPLRRRWEEVQTQARELAAKRDAAPTQSARTRQQNVLGSLLQAFGREIAAVEVLDPACGSGNFLYVALRLLLDLEKEVSVLGGQLGLGMFWPAVAPEQLHGIEINPYAHEIAQVTIWIGYIQWMQDNGYGFPSEPILRPLDAIRRMDAVLAYDEDGTPVEPAWPVADVIVGNPPFLGNKRMVGELGETYTAQLRELYSDRLPGGCDLVCYWFEKARECISGGRAKRAGLLATQSIRNGANRETLRRILESGGVFYAQADRPWILDGADVRVSMVGFDDGSSPLRRLNETTDGTSSDALARAQQVKRINANLTAGPDLTIAQNLSENAGLCYQGPVKVGPFDIDATAAVAMLSAANPNGRPSSDVIRPWMNATDLTRRSRGKYIIDFSDMPMDVASGYEAPFEYVRQHVKPMRAGNRRARRRDFWWQHGETVPGLRSACAEVARYVCTPRVAKHRLFVWVPSGTLPDSRLYAIATDSDYMLGVLHSRVHEVWALAQASRHGVGNDPTYNSTTCFETYPFPWPSGEEPREDEDPGVQTIAEAARDLVGLRQQWLNPGTLPARELKKRTLTNLYNQRPTWLQVAHRKLDDAVLDAYGWPRDLEDEELLERLLALNLERAAGQEGAG